MLNVLLTGGSGFIGKNTQESFLAQKYRILAPRHAELDLLDEECVRRYFADKTIDVVIHSAAKPGHRNVKDTSGVYYCNARMFFNLVRNADKFGKMINIGSGAVYDMRFYQPKMKEEHFDTHVPVDESGFNKYTCYKYIERTENLVDLRVFGIFGKYEDYAIRFPSNMICKALFGLPLTMRQNRRFDYVYIDDFMNVLDYFISEKAAFTAYNVTPDSAIELYEIARIVRDLAGGELPIVVAKEGMGLEYSGDNARLRKEMPGMRYQPISLAIEKLFSWYQQNKAFLDMGLLAVDK